MVTVLAAVAVFVATCALIMPEITANDDIADEQGIAVASENIDSASGDTAADNEQDEDAADDSDASDSDVRNAGSLLSLDSLSSPLSKNDSSSSESSDKSSKNTSDKSSESSNKSSKENTESDNSKTASDDSRNSDSDSSDKSTSKTASSADSGSKLFKTSSKSDGNGGYMAILTGNIYKVTLKYTDKAELPDDAVFCLTELGEDTEEYKAAKEAVITEKKANNEDFDEDNLGIAALDISILDADGSEIEPADGGSVDVQIEMNSLPEDTDAGMLKDTMEVQHIKGNTSGSSETTAKTVADTGSATDGTVKIKKDTAIADFSVDSFSVFTITWSISSTNSTRVADVNIHYVNETGAELGNPTSMPSSELYADGIADTATLEKWAKDAANNNKTRMQGYTYKEAHLETHDGSTITALKAVATNSGANTTYSLQYKLAGSDDWTTYTDSVSKQSENNVEVYLIFTKNLSVKVHYVDENGDEIDDSDTKYAEDLTDTDGVQVSTWQKTITGYTYDTSSTPKLNSATGTDVYSVRADQDGDEYNLWYKKNSTASKWTKTTETDSADVYLFYTKSSFNQKITIHHTDPAGVTLKDSNGKDIVTVIDGADLGSSGVDFSTYAKSIDGYKAFSTSDLNVQRNYNSTTKATTYNPNNQIWISSTNDATGTSYTRSVTGVPFRWMKYDSENSKVVIGTGNSSSAITWSEDSITQSGNNIDVYMMYMPQATLHAVDSEGTELAHNTYGNAIGYEDDGNWTNSYSDLGTVSGVSGSIASVYVKKSDGTTQTIYTGTPTSVGGGWHFDKSTGKWTTRININKGTTTDISGEFITDIYLSYPTNLVLTVHHVDSDGEKVAADTTTTLSSTSTATIDGADSTTKLGTTVSGYTAKSMDFGRTGAYETAGTTFASMTYTLDSNTWTNAYKATSSGDAVTDSTIRNEIWVVYEKQKTVTIHRIDTDGKKIADDIKQTLTGTTTFTPATDASNSTYTVTDYTLTSGKYGMTAGTGSTVTGGTSFYSFTYTYGADGSWSNSYKSGADSSDMAVGDFQNEIWYVYSGTDKDGVSVVVHFVDEDGNAITGTNNNKIGNWTTRAVITHDSSNKWTVQGSGSGNWNGANNTWNGVNLTGKTNDNLDYGGASDFTKLIPSGYTFVGEYLGPDFNTDADKMVNSVAAGGDQYIQWYYNSSGEAGKKWYTSHGSSATQTHGLTGTGVYNEYITDIYWVYRNTKTLNVHYVYENSDGTLSKISGQDEKTITPSADTKTSLNSEKNAPTTITSGDTTYSYVSTRIGPSWSTSLTSGDLGPNVKQVYLQDGRVMYYNESTATLSYLRRNTWSHDGEDGRRFVITRSGSEGQYNYSLTDSRHGSLTLSSKGDGTYYASYHGEAQTTQYSYNPSTRNLTVTDWLPESQTDVYQVYTNTTEKKIWLDDDIKYSGYLKVGTSITSSDIQSGTTRTYTWYKTVTNSAGETTTSQVSRKLTGEHYNIAYAPSARTWLDLEADEGGLNSTTQTAVQYYVTMTYTDTSGNVQTIQSDPVDIQYYSQLMNGSFETPDKTDTTNYPTSKNPAGRDTQDYSNVDYKKYGGVWQTTGVGTGENRWIQGSEEWRKNTNADIEIINITNKSEVANAYRFASADAVTTADSGSQFAELNAEAAGALYQDVVTHPNEQIHYWFSHRARGWMNGKDNHGASGSGTIPEYDTMYLVIMPTKLAMTAGSDGGELKTQTDLQAFVESHGGYSTALADSEEEEVIYQNYDDGILVMKVSSSDQAWHNVGMINAYIAKAGLTRFFFMAGPTAYQNDTTEGSQEKINPTHGNFLDAVGFSQSLPPTEGFNLTVSKTFSGLSETQIASMAQSSTDPSGTTTTNPNPFTITLSDLHYNNGTEDNKPNVALNGAKLGYKVSGSEGSYTFTLTATKDGKNILTGTSTGTAKWNEDGSLTMIWSFLDQELNNGTSDDVSDQTYYYYATESNAGMSGYALTPTENVDLTHSDGTTEATAERNYRSLAKGDSASFTLTNTYKDSSSSDQPQMIVTKTFTGVTQSTIDELLGSGYQLKLQKTGDEYTDADHLVLTGDEASPVKRDENESTEAQNAVVTLQKKDNDDGSVTLRWLVEGWGAGTYKISETGFEAAKTAAGDTNVLTSVTVNGSSDGVTDLSTSTAPTTIEKSDIVVGGTTSSSLNYETDSSIAKSEDSITTGTDIELSGKTNLVIAQYTLSDSTKYIVWTPEMLSANTSQAIVNKINELWNSGEGATKATISDVDFHSSSNPGTISVKNGGGETVGGLIYNSDTDKLSFNAEENSQMAWNKYYATEYKVSGQSEDIAVANIYDPIIKIQKVSAKDGSNLKGGVFRLYKLDNNDNKLYYMANSTATNAVWSQVSNVDSNTVDKSADSSQKTSGKALSFTTESDGIIELGNIPKYSTDVTYYLEEIKAPDGYNRLAQPISFIIRKDGTVVQETMEIIDSTTGDEITVPKKDSVVDNTKATVTYPDPYYLITMTNEEGISLPITGGSGTTLFTIIGLLLIASGAFLLYKRRHKPSVETNTGRHLSITTYDRIHRSFSATDSRLMDVIHGRCCTGVHDARRGGDRR